MKRNALTTLKQWKEAKERRPFYLTGIKGVGKTYLASEFAKDFFDSFLYLSLEQNNSMAKYLDTLSEEFILPALAEYFEVQEEFLLFRIIAVECIRRGKTADQSQSKERACKILSLAIEMNKHNKAAKGLDNERDT